MLAMAKHSSVLSNLLLIGFEVYRESMCKYMYKYCLSDFNKSNAVKRVDDSKNNISFLGKLLVKPMVNNYSIFCLLGFNTSIQCEMSYGRLLISSVLVIAFYFLFGRKLIDRLLRQEMSVSYSEEEPQNIKAPG